MWDSKGLSTPITVHDVFDSPTNRDKHIFATDTESENLHVTLAQQGIVVSNKSEQVANLINKVQNNSLQKKAAQ